MPVQRFAKREEVCFLRRDLVAGAVANPGAARAIGMVLAYRVFRVEARTFKATFAPSSMGELLSNHAAALTPCTYAMHVRAA